MLISILVFLENCNAIAGGVYTYIRRFADKLGVNLS